MERKRNQYTKEYKIEAVRLIVEEGRPISEVARELEIAQSLLYRWKKKYCGLINCPSIIGKITLNFYKIIVT